MTDNAVALLQLEAVLLLFSNCNAPCVLASEVLQDTVLYDGGFEMASTTVLNNLAQESVKDVFDDATHPTPDETDDLEVFPVLLQTQDVRDLIEAAQRRGLSATGLARRLVHQYLLRTRGIVLVGNIAASENR